MDARPIVYALIIGWAVGQEPLAPSFSNWVGARDQLSTVVPSRADCSVDGTDFQLRQVLFDLKPPPP